MTARSQLDAAAAAKIIEHALVSAGEKGTAVVAKGSSGSIFSAVAATRTQVHRSELFYWVIASRGSKSILVNHGGVVGTVPLPTFLPSDCEHAVLGELAHFVCPRTLHLTLLTRVTVHPPDNDANGTARQVVILTEGSEFIQVPVQPQNLDQFLAATTYFAPAVRVTDGAGF